MNKFGTFGVRIMCEYIHCGDLTLCEDTETVVIDGPIVRVNVPRTIVCHLNPVIIPFQVNRDDIQTERMQQLKNLEDILLDGGFCGIFC